MRERAIFVLALALCLTGPAVAQQKSRPVANGDTEVVFPGKTWAKLERPKERGWSPEKLAAARKESEAIGSAAVTVVHRGRIVSEWGATDKRFNVHSIRKSCLSALYGLPGLAEKFNLDATLADLAIDDNEPVLSAVEKQATVLDLLKARSGVYHPALYETERMKRRRPARGSHAPGTFWYYNNWDFNVLGTIFERRTKMSVFMAFDEYLAKPLEMEDFRPHDGQYIRGSDSIHPAYPFRMSARDMARFGLLFARAGRWREKQIVPAAWVAECTTSYSPATDEDGILRCGYGYLWWTEYQGLLLEGAELPLGCYSARGSGGHYILVVPAWDLVIVHRMDTDDKDGPRATREQVGKLAQLIVDAMPTEARQLPPNRDSQSIPRPLRLDAIVPALMAKHSVPGVSIVGIENGRIAWERQYGVRAAGEPERVQTDTVFEAASMSKPLAAYAALKLVEQGKLDLDRPLAEYLDRPYLENEPRLSKITARMVMSHTTGFPNWRPRGWKSDGKLTVEFEPGSKFGYSGEGFLYLQRVMEHITGEPLDKYIHRTLLVPLGMKSASYVWPDEFATRAAAGHGKNGSVLANRNLFREPNAAFSLYCTPTEYALFVVEMLRRDRTGAHSLSGETLAVMLTRTSKIRRSGDQSGRGEHRTEPSFYGLGWAMDTTATGTRVRHSGSNGTGFRSYCEFYPQRRTGIVIMTNATGGAELWREVIEALRN
jgi:CubicO group peptidase (beta-lactamase class C family)